MNHVEDDVLEALPVQSGNEWPAHRTVAELMGSRPMGGQVPATPVRGFVQTPSALRLSDTAPGPATRIDIALGGLTAFLIDPVLSASECAALIEASERLGFRDEAPGISTPPGMRMNKTVHWLADEALMVPIFQRMAGLLPQRLDGATLLPRLSHRLNMYRYDDGDVFNVHIDGDWPGYALDPLRQRMVEWPSGRARLTMLLDLSGLDEGVQGGAVLPAWLPHGLGTPHRVHGAWGCAQVRGPHERDVRRCLGGRQVFVK